MPPPSEPKVQPPLTVVLFKVRVPLESTKKIRSSSPLPSHGLLSVPPIILDRLPLIIISLVIGGKPVLPGEVCIVAVSE